MRARLLVSLNIFAGTEHGSANYSKVQESSRKHTAETANKGRAPPKGGNKKYSNEYENANVTSDIILTAENIITSITIMAVIEDITVWLHRG